MNAKDNDDGHHLVLRRKRGGLTMEDRAIRKALTACHARLISDLEVEIGRVATLHDVVKAELMRLEAVRDTTGAALKLAREAHADLRGAAAIWPSTLPDSLARGEAALTACRKVPGDAALSDIVIE